VFAAGNQVIEANQEADLSGRTVGRGFHYLARKLGPSANAFAGSKHDILHQPTSDWFSGLGFEGIERLACHYWKDSAWWKLLLREAAQEQEDQ
jgi:hypothetical protein